MKPGNSTWGRANARFPPAGTQGKKLYIPSKGSSMVAPK